MKKSTIDGIEVTRTYEYPYHGKSAFGRIIGLCLVYALSTS